MDEKVEKRIRQDAETLRHPSNMPSSERRGAAIRRGMRRAQNENPRSRMKGMVYGGVAAAAIAASTLWFADAGLLQPVVEPEETRQFSDTLQTSDLQPFGKLLTSDAVLSNAWDRGLVERVDVIANAHDGMTLNIKGMVRDSRRITLFYELQSPDGHATELDKPELVDDRYGDTFASTSWIQRTSFDSQTRTTYGLATLFFDSEASDRPESLLLKVNAIAKQSTDPAPEIPQSERLGSFVVPLELSSASAQEQEIVYEQPKALTLSGQTLEIHRVLLTPLAVYLNVSEQSTNTDRLFDLIEPTLSLVRNGQTFRLSTPGFPSFIEGRTGWEMSFANDEGLVNPDTLTFGAEGIQSLPKQKLSLVLNTDEQSVLQAPDDGFTLNVSGAKDGNEELSIRYPVTEDEFGRLGLMRLGSTFKDGDGNEHEMTGSNEFVATGKGDLDSANYTFYIHKEDYPQPLTFAISMYPGGVRDKQEVTLK
ncbi:hypothetical protein [Saccharibacillus sacchari]|uniref:Uncharacterized protein n=1 Tax=Saccharibacillus sacchari TaxID=456493 RepID=A0ACC6PD75_9BACL